MVRVRHYTRISSMKKIIYGGHILARDQNKVFVELAKDRRLSPHDVEEKYDLDDGKGNAYIEFDVDPAMLQQQYNVLQQGDEYYIRGDVDLIGREPEAFFNIRGGRQWKLKQ